MKLFLLSILKRLNMVRNSLWDNNPDTQINLDKKDLTQVIGNIKSIVNDLSVIERSSMISLWERAIETQSLSSKKNFIDFVVNHLWLNGFDYESNLSLLLEYLWTTEKKFMVDFPFIYLHLFLKWFDDNYNILIEIFISFLHRKPLEKINTLEKKLSSNLDDLLFEIFETWKIPSNYTKNDIYFIIRLLVWLWYFKEMWSQKVTGVFMDFLEAEFLNWNMNGEEESSLSTYLLLKRSIVKDKKSLDDVMLEVWTLINNVNTSWWPIIIVFRSFPGNIEKSIIFQEKQYFKNKSKFSSLNIFNNDKKSFLEEFSKSIEGYWTLLSKWQVFSVSVYKKKWKNTPTRNIANDNLTDIKIAA